jgi:hypothetical protein
LGRELNSRPLLLRGWGFKRMEPPRHENPPPAPLFLRGEFRRGGDFGELSRAVNPLPSLGIKDSDFVLSAWLGAGGDGTPPLH